MLYRMHSGTVDPMNELTARVQPVRPPTRLPPLAPAREHRRPLVERLRWIRSGGRWDVKLQHLASTPVGRGLPVRQLVRLARAADVVVLPAGTATTLVGGRHTYVLAEGQLITSTTPPGNVGNGDVIAPPPGTRVTALALCDSELLVI